MPSDSALVIATFSRRMQLQLPDGELVNARIKGKRLKPVCGDRVSAMPIENESDWLITAIDERENALQRPNMRGQVEVLAANLDLLVVVAAGSPAADWFIVDRYLCAAESMRIPAIVVYNKTDLDNQDAGGVADFHEYERIGYPTLRCSAKIDSNLDKLLDLLGGKISIIVGQSGVGKSTIINKLTSTAQQRTAEVSDKSGEGRHTTVNSVMLSLSNGGAVIDSPGVRDYAPALQSPADVVHGFKEIGDAAQGCRFANCRHLREPGCAVIAAIDDDSISARRYESYRRSLALAEKLAKR
jgi:ribosome biogenesis GTPase